MSQWTPELKAEVVSKYQAKNPTPENSTELIKEIAEEIEQSPNGVRMILMQAGVYVKKDASASPSKSGDKKPAGEGTKRVSKDDAIAQLKAVIENRGAAIDEDILSKLTGKAALYFVDVLNT